MAAMNFPTPTEVGEEYVWENFTYVWDGEKWTSKVMVVPDEFVKKTGDTMTGILYLTGGNYGDPLILQCATGEGQLIFGQKDGVTNWYVGRGDPSSDNLSLRSDSLDNQIVLYSDHIHLGKDPRAGSAQGVEGSSLTRKDYVDSENINYATTINHRGSIQGILDGSDVLEYFRTNPHVVHRNMGSAVVNGPTGWTYGCFQLHLHGVAADGTLNHGFLVAMDVAGLQMHINSFNPEIGWYGWKTLTRSATDLEARIIELEARINALEGGADGNY